MGMGKSRFCHSTLKIKQRTQPKFPFHPEIHHFLDFIKTLATTSCLSDADCPLISGCTSSHL
ncbi:hypothetical protein TNCT_693281, partial [Trichonephila clavata]